MSPGWILAGIMSEVKHIFYTSQPFVFYELFVHVLCPLSIGLIIPIFFGQSGPE